MNMNKNFQNNEEVYNNKKDQESPLLVNTLEKASKAALKGGTDKTLQVKLDKRFSGGFCKHFRQIASRSGAKLATNWLGGTGSSSITEYVLESKFCKF